MEVDTPCVLSFICIVFLKMLYVVEVEVESMLLVHAKSFLMVSSVGGWNLDLFCNKHL